MRIKRIYLENFRCFKNEKIDLSEEFTVLVGNNGSGKTAILDAVAIALGGLLSGFDGVKSREILTDEVRLEHYERGSVIDSQPQFPLRITCEATIEGKPFIWTRALNKEGGRTTRNEAKTIIKYAEKVQKEIRLGDDKLILPVVSYYGTGRLWVQKKQKTEETLARIQSRFLGYTDCLDPASNEKLMTKWFEKMTYIELQEGRELPELRAVRDVLKYCVRNVDGKETPSREADIFFNVNTHELEVTFMNTDGSKERLPFRMLSDGYRNTLGMIADIAYRMAVLNPQLLENVTRETPGVVLIDEIDLHLHPKWQRHIINDLKAVFPKVQFIVTTHSPNILTTIKKENVFILNDCQVIAKTPHTYNPLDPISEVWIKYKDDGRIYSDNETVNKDLNDILNLNYKTIKDNRKGVIDSIIKNLKKKYPNKSWTKSIIQQEINKWNNRDSEGKFREYYGVALFYLQKRYSKAQV